MKFILVMNGETQADFDNGKEAIRFMDEAKEDCFDVLLMDDDVIERSYVYRNGRLWTHIPRKAVDHLNAWVIW